MIRDLHRQGVSISEISRQTGRDRKTVRAVIAGGLLPEPKPRKRRASKLDPFVPYLEQRIARGVLNAQKLYVELKERGYTGHARTVQRFVQPYREARQQEATLRFETAPGQQAQVDWGSFGTIIHEGCKRRLYAFVMTLGWSRATYVEFTVTTDAETWLRCHLHAFHYFGGLPREVLHDNLKTAVLSRSRDERIHWNPRYLDFADYYGFTPRPCRPYRAQTKGKVESGVKYVRCHFWLGCEFSDLADLNRQVCHWVDTVANLRIHGTTFEVPFARLPQENLQPLAGKPDYDTSRISYRRSSKDCLVSYAGNFYSVPFRHARQRLMVKETETGDVLILTLEGREVARHRLVVGRHQRVVVADHYAGLPLVTRQRQPVGGVQRLRTVEVPLAAGAPQVEQRPLAFYEQWLEAVA